MYLTRQGMAIASVTILQEGIEDGFRGRVFAFYDMLYNAAFALGAALFAVFMPPNGKSPAGRGGIAVGFVAAALGYWLSAGRPSASSAGESSPSGEAPAGSAPREASAGRSPSAEAQRSSS